MENEVVQPAPGPGKQSSYIPALDGLRAVAFSFVFIAHTTGHSLSHYIPAAFGVTVFFFLSGYLITTLLRKEWGDTGRIALRDFYIRRALRIFIPMYITYGVAWVLGHFSGKVGNWRGFWSSLSYTYNYAALLRPDVLLPNGFDVVWSLSVEEHFYLIFPLLFIYFMRRRFSQAVLAYVLLALCMAGLVWRTFVFFHHFPPYWTYEATDCRFDSILWGSLLALWNNPRYDAPQRLLKRYSGLLAACGIIAIVGSMFLLKSPTFREAVRYSLQGFSLYFIFFFALSHSRHWSVRWLENRSVRYIGWLSYTLYLIHRPIQWVVERHLPQRDWIISPVCFVLALAYAVLMRHAVELPLQRLRARFRHIPTPTSASIPIEGI